MNDVLVAIPGKSGLVELSTAQRLALLGFDHRDMRNDVVEGLSGMSVIPVVGVDDHVPSNVLPEINATHHLLVIRLLSKVSVCSTSVCQDIDTISMSLLKPGWGGELVRVHIAQNIGMDQNHKILVAEIAKIVSSWVTQAPTTKAR